MESQQTITVLQAYQPLLRMLTIYNLKNFQNPEQRFRQICLAIGFTIVIGGLFVLIFGDAWYCVSYKFDLNEIALPFAIMISATQMTITYIAIEIKYQQLEETIARLNNTINRSKLF